MHPKDQHYRILFMMTMLLKDGQTTEIMRARNGRKRKAKIKIANLVLGTTKSDYATPEQIPQNSLPSHASMGILATVPMTYASI